MIYKNYTSCKNARGINTSATPSPTSTTLAKTLTLALLAGSMAIPVTGWAATDCNAVTQIPKAQCEALVSLYDSTNGAKWTDAATNKWNTDNQPCGWTGVVCSGSNVTELNRAGRGLSGPLPDLTALTGLQHLWLYSNGLTGDIAILKGLTNLRTLVISGTSLRGYLGDITTLTQLEELNLTSVGLATPMPDLSSFKKLRSLSLQSTGVIGLIPSSLGSLTNLKDLNLASNQLVGNIPNLSGLTNLESMTLYSNKLTGNIPDLSALTKLTYLSLGYNNLTGSIPNFSNLVRLGYAYLQNNQLSGNIPASLGALPHPAAITLTNNKLCIPGEPLLSQLNLKTTLTSDTGWAATQKPTNCDGMVLSAIATNGSISCNGGSCQTSYAKDTQLTLTATASSGYKFDNWSGACSGNGTCQVTMTENKSVTANFSAIPIDKYALTTNATNGSISCNGGTCQTSYAKDTQLTLAATASSGYKFDNWSGACTGTGTCQVTMTENKSVTANFSAVIDNNKYTLTTNATNGSISCNGGTCQTSYAKDTQLTLTATASSGYTFKEWSGDCSGTSCQLTMTANKSVTANFSKTTDECTTNCPCTGNNCPPPPSDDDDKGNPHCSEAARYSFDDYTLTIPVLEIPIFTILGEATDESLFYEITLQQINGSSDRFALQEVMELLGVVQDTPCAQFDLGKGIATLPTVNVKMPLYNPLTKQLYGYQTDSYEVIMKWMSMLGKEIFIVESLTKK